MRLKNNEEALIERITRAIAKELRTVRRQSAPATQGATGDIRVMPSSRDSREATAA